MAHPDRRIRLLVAFLLLFVGIIIPGTIALRRASVREGAEKAERDYQAFEDELRRDRAKRDAASAAYEDAARLVHEAALARREKQEWISVMRERGTDSWETKEFELATKGCRIQFGAARGGYVQILSERAGFEPIKLKAKWDELSPTKIFELPIGPGFFYAKIHAGSEWYFEVEE